MACQEYRVGVKIPWLGNLTPHPVLCLGSLKKSKSGSNKDQIFSYVIVP